MTVNSSVRWRRASWNLRRKKSLISAAITRITCAARALINPWPPALGGQGLCSPGHAAHFTVGIGPQGQLTKLQRHGVIDHQPPPGPATERGQYFNRLHRLQ